MKIRNLTANALVPGDISAHTELHEWKVPSVGADGVLDASASSHSLLVRCSNCGLLMEEQESSGLLECPDCGEEDFEVQQLFQRAIVEVTDVVFEVTGKGSRRFLHITIPPEWKKAKPFYTIDGSEPTPKSTMYRHPFSIERKEYVVNLILYTDEKRSNLISYYIPPVDGYRYNCPICTTQVISALSTAQCHKCGFVRTFLMDGTCSDSPVGIICPVCSAEFKTTVNPAQCPKCGSGYSYVVGGEGWTYKGHGQVCPSCLCLFNYKAGVQEHCPKCGAHVIYKNHAWIREGAYTATRTTIPRSPKPMPVSIPTYNPKRKVSWNTNSDSLGALVLGLVIAIIIILLGALQL